MDAGSFRPPRLGVLTASHDRGVARGLYMLLLVSVTVAVMSMLRMAEQGAELASLRKHAKAATDDKEHHRNAVLQHAGSIRHLRARLDACEAREARRNDTLAKTGAEGGAARRPTRSSKTPGRAAGR